VLQYFEGDCKLYSRELVSGERNNRRHAQAIELRKKLSQFTFSELTLSYKFMT